MHCRVPISAAGCYALLDRITPADRPYCSFNFISRPTKLNKIKQKDVRNLSRIPLHTTWDFNAYVHKQYAQEILKYSAVEVGAISNIILRFFER